MFPCSKETWLCTNPNCECKELVVDKRETRLTQDSPRNQHGPKQEVTAYCTSCDRLYFVTRTRMGEFWGAMDHDPVILTGKEREHYLRRLDEQLGIIRRSVRRKTPVAATA